ncbi:hypothetical protein VTO42DRAFT_3067 [Malbranchea cinnamomea]
MSSNERKKSEHEKKSAASLSSQDSDAPSPPPVPASSPQSPPGPEISAAKGTIFGAAKTPSRGCCQTSRILANGPLDFEMNVVRSYIHRTRDESAFSRFQTLSRTGSLSPGHLTAAARQQRQRATLSQQGLALTNKDLRLSVGKNYLLYIIDDDRQRRVFVSVSFPVFVANPSET